MDRSEWRPWGVLVGLFLVSAGFIAYVIVPASVLPVFVAEYGIDKPTASASISAVFLTWAILQIPGGFVMDRYDNRRLVLLGAGTFILAALTGTVANSYSVFLVTRLVSGASVVFVFIGSVNILNHVLPERRRALGVSLFIASPPFGLAVAQFATPRIAAAFGWRAAVLAYTLAALVGSLLFLAFRPAPVTKTERATGAELLAALRNPPVLLVSFASFCTYAVWTFLNTWMPTYGNEVLGIDLAAAGAATALVPLAGILSRPGGGWLSDVLDGRLVPVIAASFVGTLGLLYALSNAPSPTAFAVLLALTGGAVNLAVGLYLVYVALLADESTQGTSLAVLVTFSQVGNLVAPVVGGWLIVSFSWRTGFGFGMGLAVLGLATILLVPSITPSQPRSS